MAEKKPAPKKRPTRSSGRDESAKERVDRNLSELLQELRVALPGVQVLFAFLLTVPFSSGFAELTEFQRDLYFGVLLGAALSAALLIAPTAGHRILFRRQQKEYLVRVYNRFAIAGLGVLALCMCGVILLISDVLFGPLACAISTTAAALVFFGLWYVGPVIRRAQLEEID